MSLRTIYTLTGILIVCAAILLLLNLGQIISGKIPEPFLKSGTVQKIEITYQDKPLLMNFEQQKELVRWINRSVRVDKIREEGTKEKPIFEKITIYRFNQSSIELRPIIYVNNDLIYSAPAWNPKGYMMDLSDGEMKDVIRKVISE